MTIEPFFFFSGLSLDGVDSVFRLLFIHLSTPIQSEWAGA
jgi:hypothetical protein